MWKTIHSLLLPLVLMSGSLVTCEPINLQPEPSPSITSSPSNTDQGDLKKSFDDFQTSLDDFMKDIVAVENNSKEEKSVNSSKVNKKLIKLEEEVKKYKNQILSTKNKENLEQNFNGINQNIDNIKQITEKLEDGLGEDEIDQVRKYLDTYEDSWGPLDPKTAKKINESLTTNSEQLKAQIIEVILANENEAEINKLKDELKNISNELNEWKYSILILGILVVIIILALIAILILIKLLVNESKSRRRKKSTRVTNNTVSSTSNSDTEEINRQLQQLQQEINRQLQQSQQEINRQLQQSQQEIYQRLEIKLNDLQNKSSKMVQNQQPKIPDNVARDYIEPRRITNSLPSQVTPEPQRPDHQYSGSSAPGLILTYQQNPRLLLKNAIEVSETDHSIDQRRLGDSQGAILEKVKKGNYCILHEDGVDYMVPKNNIRINPHSLNTVENLFECQGYQPGYSGFQLIKPARVSVISRGEVWQLVERGILQFS